MLTNDAHLELAALREQAEAQAHRRIDEWARRHLAKQSLMRIPLVFAASADNMDPSCELNCGLEGVEEYAALLFWADADDGPQADPTIYGVYSVTATGGVKDRSEFFDLDTQHVTEMCWAQIDRDKEPPHDPR